MESQGFDARTWDDRYAASELVWSAEPNRWVVEETADLPPGRALDVACGEGRNALWLARRGWTVTGIDFSGVALRKARQLAAALPSDAASRLAWVHADVTAYRAPAGSADLAILAYLQLAARPRRQVVRAAAAALAPGGTLLVVGHDSANLAEGVGGPQDPAVLFTAADVAADLAGLPGVRVERADRVRRPVESPDGVRYALDALLRARATGAGS